MLNTDLKKKNVKKIRQDRAEDRKIKKKSEERDVEYEITFLI